MYKLKIRVYNTRERLENFVYVVDIQGVLDDASAIELNKKLDDLVTSKKRNIILNMKKVEYVTTHFITPLSQAALKARKAKGDICLLDLPPKVFQAFKVMGASRIFKVFDHEKTAVDYFRFSR